MFKRLNSLYLTSLSTLTRREIKRFLRIWVQTLLPSLVTTLLYMLIFGRIMGKRIQIMPGVDYMAYITPGLIMMAIVMNSFSNVSSSFYGMRFQKSIEELLIAPIPDSLLMLGFVLGGMARGLIVGLLMMLLSLCFTHLPIPNPGTLLAISLSTALLFSLAGFLNALFAKSFDDISMIPMFILTPLTQLGGVFYPLNDLSPFWQRISLFNPILYVANAFRYALLGISDVSISYALPIVWVCCLGLILLNHHLLTKVGKLRG